MATLATLATDLGVSEDEMRAMPEPELKEMLTVMEVPVLTRAKALKEHRLGGSPAVSSPSAVSPPSPAAAVAAPAPAAAPPNTVPQSPPAAAAPAPAAAAAAAAPADPAPAAAAPAAVSSALDWRLSIARDLATRDALQSKPFERLIPAYTAALAWRARTEAAEARIAELVAADQQLKQSLGLDVESEADSAADSAPAKLTQASASAPSLLGASAAVPAAAAAATNATGVLPEWALRKDSTRRTIALKTGLLTVCRAADCEFFGKVHADTPSAEGLSWSGGHFCDRCADVDADHRARACPKPHHVSGGAGGGAGAAAAPPEPAATEQQLQASEAAAALTKSVDELTAAEAAAAVAAAGVASAAAASYDQSMYDEVQPAARASTDPVAGGAAGAAAAAGSGEGGGGEEERHTFSTSGSGVAMDTMTATSSLPPDKGRRSFFGIGGGSKESRGKSQSGLGGGSREGRAKSGGQRSDFSAELAAAENSPALVRQQRKEKVETLEAELAALQRAGDAKGLDLPRKVQNMKNITSKQQELMEAKDKVSHSQENELKVHNMAKGLAGFGFDVGVLAPVTAQSQVSRMEQKQLEQQRRTLSQRQQPKQNGIICQGELNKMGAITGLFAEVRYFQISKLNTKPPRTVLRWWKSSQDLSMEKLKGELTMMDVAQVVHSKDGKTHSLKIVLRQGAQITRGSSTGSPQPRDEKTRPPIVLQTTNDSASEEWFNLLNESAGFKRSE